MKNKKVKRNIFKTKNFYLILSLIMIITNPTYSQELKEVNVKVNCNNFMANVSFYCGGKDVRENKPFTDSPNPPRFNRSNECICGGAESIHNDHGWQCKNNVYKHILPNGTVMYSSNDDPSHFISSGDIINKCKWSFNAMDLLKAMPEIGTSRIDPNLIEY